MESKIFPNLSTKRLVLRKLETSDTREIFALRSNPSVNQFLDRDPATTEADAAIFINKITDLIGKNQGIYWAICLKENPRLIGTICLYDFSTEMDTAEIGYELLPFYQHRGIMQEALSVVVPYGLKVMKLKSIAAFPTADNLSSIKLLERNGFLLEDDAVERKDNLVKYVRR